MNIDWNFWIRFFHFLWLGLFGFWRFWIWEFSRGIDLRIDSNSEAENGICMDPRHDQNGFFQFFWIFSKFRNFWNFLIFFGIFFLNFLAFSEFFEFFPNFKLIKQLIKSEYFRRYFTVIVFKGRSIFIKTWRLGNP